MAPKTRQRLHAIEGHADRTRGRVTVVALCAGSVLTATGFEWTGHAAFGFVFGDLSPGVVSLGVCVLGLLSLESLSRRGWLNHSRPGRPSHLAVVAVGATLTAPVILVDRLGGFPPDVHVPWPASLLFYPAIAVVAACTFHAIPLGIASLVWPKRNAEAERTALLTAMGCASLIEPALQVAWGAGHSPTWANTYVGFHVLLFNAIALHVFTRRGFTAAIVFRLSYYLIWHVAWGHARLAPPFG